MSNAFKIIRSYICTDDTSIGLVQDNARYHTTDYVSEAFKCMKVDVFPTVPYSPQLNEPAEACFGYCKNNIETYVPDPNIKIKSNEIGRIISNKWEKVISKFDGAMSGKYYLMWIEILKQIAEGRPLHGNRISISTIDKSEKVIAELRNILTIRNIDDTH